MSRSRSRRVQEVKSRLQTRLVEGVHRPGDRFPSAREIAARFDISYQTAHRLLAELTEEGLLERRERSGSFVPGGRRVYDGAQLLFSARSEREGSFGARLREELERRLKASALRFRVDAAEAKLRRDLFPVLWEAPLAREACLSEQRPALLLNDRPAPGLSATFLDSVSIDDFSGGAGAAELLERAIQGSQIAVLSGPRDDARSRERVAGFRSRFVQAHEIEAGGWFYEDGLQAAPAALRLGANGIFCANDRLASAVAAWARQNERELPPLVGFDDAPVAEEIGLTTMAIPWEEMANSAVEMIKRRINGDASAARQVILTPRPVVR